MIVWSTADFYGASELIGTRRSSFSSFPKVSWTHGCIFGTNPEWPIFLSKHEMRFKKHLVTNKYQRDALSFLNLDVHAVGLPFAYAHRRFFRDVPRDIKRLYVPSHSIANQNIALDIENMLKVAHCHGCSDVLLNQVDYCRLTKNSSSPATQINDHVKFIKGADIRDSHCLERMVNIFQSTRSIITDAIGSHLYYATLCGCDVHLVDVKRPSLKSYERTLMRMSSPWREAFEAYFRAYVYGKEIIDQVSCFIDQSRDVAMQQAHEMIGIDCLVSDEIIRRMGSESSFSSQIFIDTYLIMRKLRMVNDY